MLFIASSDTYVLYWFLSNAGAAIAIGEIAAAEGKSPFQGVNR
jgi:hypothetical protein